MSKFKPGEVVFVVNRDEDGTAYDVSGFVFVAEVADAVIVTPKVYGCDGLAEIMKYHIGETAKDYELSLLSLGVFPADDCYRTKYSAECALKEEAEDLED